MKKNIFSRVGSEAQYGPRLAGEILHDYLENSNEPLAVAYREQTVDEQRFNNNTELCVDVKTILRSDRVSKIGKSYQGVFTRDTDEHFTFTETIIPAACKRNPQVYVGQYITITRRDDGTLRPNFRPIPKDLSLERYATGVANELLWALEGLVEER
jgi:hypothetical protein